MRFSLLLVYAAVLAIARQSQAPIIIEYPADGSVFPPEITPPTFIWRDSSNAHSWSVDVRFESGGSPLHAAAVGERLKIGEIDPRCLAETNTLPELTPEQAISRAWKPDVRLWAEIKRRSTEKTATVVVTGLSASGAPLSQGQVRIRTSSDPVGAPVFYRDVPLMPSETEKGVIKPIASHAVRLIQWRLRDLAQPESRIVLHSMPTCGNCHSFSLDGKTLGMDLDGPQNHKGIYALTEVKPQTSIRDSDVIEWASARGRLEGKMRVGFMSQVSPGGQFVVTTISGSALNPKNDAELPSNYYVANFTDYRFLQVFYPTRGILAWYSRLSGMLQPLPGADDPDFVQTGAVWSPDGRYLVFARAQAKDPDPPGVPLALRANDPNEVQIRYDLYRVPFSAGKGGTPEPIEGAAFNGMSNSFPKVSPDGRWIVFVQARNGLLMRPDSQLYIVPAAGGQARRMNCNTPLMNSWHSFSPNGRWMVFSSKARSPYTQMYITHLDADGNDTPPILIENSTAANRAVNIPEFVNIPPDGLQSIVVPAVDSYRLFDTALELQQQGDLEKSIAAYRQVLASNPRHADAHNHLGMVLFQSGRLDDAAQQFRAALQIRPAFIQARCGLGSTLATQGNIDGAISEFRRALSTDSTYAPAHNNLGLALMQKGQSAEALDHFRRAVENRPGDVPSRSNLGTALASLGRTSEAVIELRKAISLDSSYVPAHFNLGLALASQGKTAEALSCWNETLRLQPDHLEALNQTAWVLSTSADPQLRNGKKAVEYAQRAATLSGGRDPEILDTLAASYAEMGSFDQAIQSAESATRLATAGQARRIADRLAQYRAHQPHRQLVPGLKSPGN